MGGDGHLLALRPTPHAPTWQVVTSLKPAADGTWAEPSLRHLQDAIDAHTGGCDVRLADPAWLSTWRYNLRMVDTYRAGPVFLAGDSAHVHSPFGGFGMNTGIQDAYNLGWKLALVLQGAADGSLLDSYEAERLPVAAAVLAESDRRFSAAMPPQWARPLLVLILRRFIARQQQRDRTDHPHYQTGPLTVGDRGRLRAGDVAPDGIVRRDGVMQRLSDVFRGPHFTALFFGVARELDAAGDVVRTYAVAPQDCGDPNTLVDIDGTVRSAYGACDGSLVAVRPDGYIGLTSRRSDRHTLADYLARIGLHRPQLNS